MLGLSLTLRHVASVQTDTIQLRNLQDVVSDALCIENDESKDPPNQPQIEKTELRGKRGTYVCVYSK